MTLFISEKQQVAYSGTEGTGGTPKSVVNKDIFGNIVERKGEVSIFRKFKKLTPKIALTLHLKDRIITKKGASLDIEMGDKNNIHVAEDSKLTLTKKWDGKKEEILLELLSGSLRCKLDSLKGRSFRIKTPVAVAGVRGTDFVTSFQPELGPNAFAVTVLSGEVSVAGLDEATKAIGQPTFVKPNFRIQVSATGVIAAVVAVPAIEMQQLRASLPVKIRIAPEKKAQNKEESKAKKDDKKSKEPKKDKEKDAKKSEGKDDKKSKEPKKVKEKDAKKSEGKGDKKSKDPKKDREKDEKKSEEKDDKKTTEKQTKSDPEKDEKKENDTNSDESQPTETSTTETEITSDPIETPNEIIPDLDIEIEIPTTDIDGAVQDQITDAVNEALQDEIKEVIQQIETIKLRIQLRIEE